MATQKKLTIKDASFVNKKTGITMTYLIISRNDEDVYCFIDADKEAAWEKAKEYVKSNSFSETDGFTQTNLIVAGDTIKFSESVFAGSFRNARFIGERTNVAKVLKESYGSAKGQHTFTLKITESVGVDPIEKGSTIRRKGRNLYRNKARRLVWDNEDARDSVAAEKHARGDKSRAEQAGRRAEKYGL